METLNEQDVIREAREIFRPNQVVAEIDQDQAREIGRELSDRQYRMIGANVIRAGSTDNVEALLWQIDHSHRYRDALVKNPNMLIGPYYQQFDGQDFCPQGIGVWLPTQEID